VFPDFVVVELSACRAVRQDQATWPADVNTILKSDIF
ncbi:unnamed protein product, partial [marine sediment metagenome]